MTPIAKHFKKIFGCRYHYDEKTGVAKWPAIAVDYTTKTQHLFRINKGIENSRDNIRVNEYTAPMIAPSLTWRPTHNTRLIEPERRALQ